MLLDENLPRLLKDDLLGFTVRSVAEAGWAGAKNGELLRRADAEYDVFLTADRSLPNQQNLSRLRLGVVVLVAGSTKLEDLQPLVPALREALMAVAPGQLLYVPLWKSS